MQKVSENSIVSVMCCVWNMQTEQQLHNIVHTVVTRLIEGLCLNPFPAVNKYICSCIFVFCANSFISCIQLLQLSAGTPSVLLILCMHDSKNFKLSTFIYMYNCIFTIHCFLIISKFQ